MITAASRVLSSSKYISSSKNMDSKDVEKSSSEMNLEYGSHGCSCCNPSKRRFAPSTPHWYQHQHHQHSISPNSTMAFPPRWPLYFQTSPNPYRIPPKDDCCSPRSHACYYPHINRRFGKTQ